LRQSTFVTLFHYQVYKKNCQNIQVRNFKNQVQWKPLNVITLGRIQSDEINLMITMGLVSLCRLAEFECLE
jgi:hypothetical protein